MRQNPDFKWAILGLEDGTLRLWNLASGNTEWSVNAHQDVARSVFITPDGNRLLSESFSTLKLWDLQSKPPKLISTYISDDVISAYSSSNNAKSIVVGEMNGRVCLLKLEEIYQAKDIPAIGNKIIASNKTRLE